MIYLNKKTLEYYEYGDVINYLCEIMGIGEKNFRQYHTIYGGTYKDLWHVWINLFEVHNDSYQYFGIEDLDTEFEYYVEQNGGEWTRPFFEALLEFFETYGYEHTIHYSW